MKAFLFHSERGRVTHLSMKTSTALSQTHIFDFSDYRLLLRSYVNLKKLNSKTWSLGTWARTLGLKSSATLVNIINGKRHPSHSLSVKIADSLDFQEEEKLYFLELIEIEKASNNPPMKMILIERLRKSYPNYSSHTLELEVFNSISKWYYYAIRELILLPDFSENPSWIKKRLRFPITIAQIENCLKDLEKLGLICKNAQGRFEVIHQHIKSTEGIHSEGLKQFHEQMITFAKESIRNVDLPQRDISGRTLNIREADLPELKKHIQAFRENTTHLFENNDLGSNTYQLNIQLFPMTQNTIEGDSL